MGGEEVQEVRNFTVEEVRMLADVERRMDVGEQPYVVNTSGRLAVSPEVMSELGLVSGQSASPTLCLAIVTASLASMEATIALGNITAGSRK